MVMGLSRRGILRTAFEAASSGISPSAMDRTTFGRARMRARLLAAPIRTVQGSTMPKNDFFFGNSGLEKTVATLKPRS